MESAMSIGVYMVGDRKNTSGATHECKTLITCMCALIQIKKEVGN